MKVKEEIIVNVYLNEGELEKLLWVLKKADDYSIEDAHEFHNMLANIG